MRILVLLVLFCSGSAFASNEQEARDFFNKNSCDISSDETLICEALMCNPIGLAINESRSECLKVNRRLAWYLATLGFWEDPPKCMSRDSSCNKTGRATREDGSSDIDFPDPCKPGEECWPCLPGEVCDDPIDPPFDDPCEKPKPGEICDRPKALQKTTSVTEIATEEVTSIEEIADKKE